MYTVYTLYVRGHEWSLTILQGSQNYASAQNAHRILVGAHLLVLVYFYNCLHAWFLVGVDL